jgi:hypothetical protein
MARNDQTFTAKVRSLWSGNGTGDGNADPERRRLLPAHSYRLCLVTGVQPGLSEVLLSEHEASAGTPQRFLWLPATDPQMPDEEPPEPDPLPWRVPSVPAAGYVAEVCDEAAAPIRAAHRARQRQAVTGGGGLSPDLDGHALLTREKVALGLAVLHGGLDVTPQWWALAGVVMRVSDSMRDECRAVLARAGAERNRARGRSDAARAEGYAEAVGERVEKVAATVARRVHKHADTHPEGSCPSRCLSRAVASQYRDVRDEAISHAAEVGWIVPDGDRWQPGGSQPA